ncbi:hypothetical protein BBJ28_00005302 [Nothophytophthora sp. Chile5]|nr:hypothetical protein BBJ28_00005302 [Nothophytophthora sp. Chile5]
MPMPPELHAKCTRLHAKLTRHALAWPFLEPVDPVALNVPTYFDVISNPMDLGTMGGKLSAGDYADPLGYRADLLLMFENAIEFNKDDLRDDSVARLQAVALNEWEKLFSEAATTDWAQLAEQQAQDQFLERARDARMLGRWKKDSFVARFNRDKLAQRRRLAASHGE